MTDIAALRAKLQASARGGPYVPVYDQPSNDYDYMDVVPCKVTHGGSITLDWDRSSDWECRRPNDLLLYRAEKYQPYGKRPDKDPLLSMVMRWCFDNRLSVKLYSMEVMEESSDAMLRFAGASDKRFFEDHFPNLGIIYQMDMRAYDWLADNTSKPFEFDGKMVTFSDPIDEALFLTACPEHRSKTRLI